MYAAHMDEIGLVVTKINLDGSLKVNKTGGLMPWKLGEGPVEILGDQETIVGVLSMGSTHTANAASQMITWDDVQVLTGLLPAQLKAAGVRPGSTAVSPTKHHISACCSVGLTAVYLHSLEKHRLILAHACDALLRPMPLILLVCLHADSTSTNN